MTATYGFLFADPVVRPLSAAGVTMPLCYFTFYLTGSTTAVAPFQNGTLTTPFGSNVVTADAYGGFPPIYMNPATVYRVQLHDASGVLLEDVDPYVVPMNATGGPFLNINASSGEILIPAPTGSVLGSALTINTFNTSLALTLNGWSAGQPAIAINNTVLTGAQTATFTALNKPGSFSSAPTKWLPLAADGAVYYLPLWP